MKFLLITVIVALTLALSGASSTCKDEKKDIQDCKIKYHVCETLFGFDVEYQAEAKDEDSGDKEKSDWHSTSDSAARHATVSLFQKDLKCTGYDDYTCNCQDQIIDQASCQLKVVVCFYFKDTNAVEDKEVTYRGWAFDSSNHDHQGTSDGFKDPTECGNAAAMDLFSKYSDIATNCGYGASAAGLGSSAVNTTALLEGAFKPAQLDWELPKPTGKLSYRKPLTDSCNGPHESCCEAPMRDPNNCPDSARTSDCDAQKACCCA